MLHLILLVLCWIFAAVVILVEAPGNDEANVATTMVSALFLGTLFWLVLEGIYRWVVPLLF